MAADWQDVVSTCCEIFRDSRPWISSFCSFRRRKQLLSLLETTSVYLWDEQFLESDLWLISQKKSLKKTREACSTGGVEWIAASIFRLLQTMISLILVRRRRIRIHKKESRFKNRQISLNDRRCWYLQLQEMTHPSLMQSLNC